MHDSTPGRLTTQELMNRLLADYYYYQRYCRHRLQQDAAASSSPPMPRVVDDQRAKFEQDDMLQLLASEHEVHYSRIPHATEIEERRQQFRRDCAEGRIPLAFPTTGLNLDLAVQMEEDGELPSTSGVRTTNGDRRPADYDYARIGRDPNREVAVNSGFILNGVSVRWKGTIQLSSLRGKGRLEFDESQANLEAERLRTELDQQRHMQQQRAALAAAAAAAAVPSLGEPLARSGSHSSSASSPSRRDRDPSASSA